MQVVMFLLGAVDAVLDKTRCMDAARDAALTAARGGDGVATGRARAPDGATVTVSRDGDTMIATVTMQVRPLRVGSLTVSATAVAAVEPGPVP
jgi:hypothetical protein